MANRRMFSVNVVDTDRFLEMPLSSQALYFHLGLHADDDGFVASPKKILKTTGCKEDDMRVLISKRYVIAFETGVIVITDWKENNQIRSDRCKPTRFQEEFNCLTEKSGAYQLTTACQPNGCIGKDSIVKDSIVKDSIDNTICSEPDKSAPSGSGILLNLIDGSDYDVPEDKIKTWEQAYPAVNIRQELLRMASWLDANPTRKKTRRGITRFINGWLERAQNRGGTYQNDSRPYEEGGIRRNGENSEKGTESESTLKLW